MRAIVLMALLGISYNEAAHVSKVSVKNNTNDQSGNKELEEMFNEDEKAHVKSANEKVENFDCPALLKEDS